MKEWPIKDNPYCEFCKRRYCKNKKTKNNERDYDLDSEIKTINIASDIYGIPLKQTEFKYCPLDFYCPDIPIMGDVTTPRSKAENAKRKWILPITERWATPGWVIEYFKLSTLIDSAACAGLLSFYIWSFEDQIRILSATDAVNKFKDTMYDELTIKSGLHKKPENKDMPRSKGKFFNPHRLYSLNHYIPLINNLIDYYKHNEVIDSADDLEQEDY